MTPRNAPPRNGTDRGSGWRSRLAIFITGLLLFETLTGLSIWLLPFSVPNQLAVLLHALGGIVFLLPYVVYQLRHWLRYRRRAWSHYQVTGYVAFAAALLNLLSGIVLTFQALFGPAISYAWDTAHIVTTIALVAFVVPHIALLVIRNLRGRADAATAVVAAQRRWLRGTVLTAAAGFVALAVLSLVQRPLEWRNEFPADYEFAEGDTPFSPSLARTESGGAYDDRSLSGSKGCGSPGCHEAIYEEWSTSAHRWSSMDPAFQAIQEVMAKQNGPRSTRYCGGCHDPISLFSGTKNVFTDRLSSLRGYNEGISCLVCHSVRETDLKGNANYVIRQPERYMFETDERPAAKFLSDFLIRAYPGKHVDALSKRLFKTPEYCAACHKQFIDEEVNQVGWVQLQNQYDNWRKSRWNPEGEPDKVVECRECHMPLQDTFDPAAGDDLDPYRSKHDGKHRDHRFIAANSFIPRLLRLPGWEEHRDLTRAWLRGERPIPEIEYKWASGPAVSLEIQAPDSVRPGQDVDIRVVVKSNKVGHDFPTGPLDIIQSWLHVEVTDANGAVLLSSGGVDSRHFIQPGAFMFKAEPVDRYGNLIDRHNLWEMVGVRYRRALFPGFSDVAHYTATVPPSGGAREIHVKASLDYRKIDQYLLNFVFGQDNQLTAPVITMATRERTIRVRGLPVSSRRGRAAIDR